MRKSDLTTTGSGNILDKGMDILKDPNASKSAKIGAVGVMAIGAIAFVAHTTIDAMKQDTTH